MGTHVHCYNQPAKDQRRDRKMGSEETRVKRSNWLEERSLADAFSCQGRGRSRARRTFQSLINISFLKIIGEGGGGGGGREGGKNVRTNCTIFQ